VGKTRATENIAPCIFYTNALTRMKGGCARLKITLIAVFGGLNKGMFKSLMSRETESSLKLLSEHGDVYLMSGFVGLFLRDLKADRSSFWGPDSERNIFLVFDLFDKSYGVQGLV
jgi:hypothetical protein